MININDVDKDGKYELSEIQKEFVKYYIEFKNIPLVAQFIGIDESLAVNIFKGYGVQEEIKRINTELYRKKFNNKMLSLSELGSYISSLITNEDVPINEQLNKKEKLDAVRLLINIYDLKNKSIDNPAELNVYDYTTEEEIKKLSLSSIKSLLNEKGKEEKKNELIKTIDKAGLLTIEDKALMQSLSIDELVTLLNEVNGGE